MTSQLHEQIGALNLKFEKQRVAQETLQKGCDSLRQEKSDAEDERDAWQRQFVELQEENHKLIAEKTGKPPEARPGRPMPRPPRAGLLTHAHAHMHTRSLAFTANARSALCRASLPLMRPVLLRANGCLRLDTPRVQKCF